MRKTKSKDSRFVVILCFLIILSGNKYSCLYAQGFGYDNNRIAISADGNTEPDPCDFNRWTCGDSDDVGALPVALAIFAKLELQDKVVHVSYNNYIGSPAGPDHKNRMKLSADGSIKRWHYDAQRFFDATKQLDEAIISLGNEMAKSKRADPLYLLQFGPSELTYQAVKTAIDKGKIDALSHVYIVSHSRFNEDQLRRRDHHTLSQAISLSGDRIHFKRIKDQNNTSKVHEGFCSEHDYSPYAWMETHEDASIKWLYTVIREGVKKADVSDAGMAFYLVTGDDSGNPEKLRKMLGHGIDLESNQ